MSIISNSSIDYTSKDYEAFRTAMLNELSIRLPEYTDRSQTDAGIVILELLAKGLDILSFYQDIYANETFLPTLEQRTNALVWCEILGYTPLPAKPAQFKQVFVLNATQGTDTIIPAGTKVKTTETTLEKAIYYEVAEDLTIPAGKLGNEKSGEDYLYTATVVEGSTIEGDIIGVSDGTSNQSFELSYSNALVDSIDLYVNEGYGYTLWTRVNSFIDSSTTSKHYMAVVDDYDITTIVFGNGVNGKIPVSTSNNIYADYRVGGGEQGNVAAQKINKLDSSLSNVASTFNPSSAFILGEDKESVESIKINAPAYARTLWRAVTLQDHVDLVKQNFTQVRYAAAVQDGTDIDKINLYILPKTGYTLAEITSGLTSFFAERQIVGTKIAFFEPSYKSLTIEARLVVKSNYVQTTVKTAVEVYLTDYFASGNYDFGTDLSLSELMMNVQTNVEGVSSFRITVPADDIVSPATNEIIQLTSATITASGGIV